MHPVLKRGGLFSDWELLPRAMFAARLARVQATVAAAGDAAWLIYGDAQRYGDVAYVSHFVPRLRSALIVVPRRGDPTILCSISSRDVPATKILTWFDNVRPCARVAPAAVEVVAEAGLAAGPLGVVGVRASMPIAEWDALAAGLPDAVWSQRDDAMAALRRVKDPAEDAAVRRAADAVGAGLAAATTAFAPGRTVRQGTADVDRAIRYGGAEDVRLLVAAGDAAGSALAPPDDRVLAAGDTVLLFAGAEVQRYWAEGARTFVLGEPDAAAARLIDRAHRALDVLVGGAIGGARVADVAAGALDELGGRHAAVAARYGFGHGIGLDAHEAPAITLDSTDLIPNDGALALHVVLHEETRGAAAGTTVVLRDGRPTTLIAR